MLFQMQQLSSSDSGYHVRHPVVIADGGMLIIAGGIPCLGCQKTGTLNLCFVAAQQHTAAGGGDDFVAVKRKNAIISKGSKLLPFKGASQRFRSILDQRNLMLFADIADAVDLRRCSVQMHSDDSCRMRIFFKGFFQSDRIHIPGVGF